MQENCENMVMKWSSTTFEKSFDESDMSISRRPGCPIGRTTSNLYHHKLGKVTMNRNSEINEHEYFALLVV